MSDNSTQAYTHATVIDATGAPSRPDQTVLVTDGRITTVGPTAQVPIPAETTTRNLSGQYIIPGLVDMHVHSDNSGAQHFPALYIANGVTTVREMWGQEHLHQWRRETAAGRMLGPRSIIASPLLDGSPALWEDIPGEQPVITATTAEEGRRAVNRARDEGADFIKVYSRLEREPYFAILDEAYKLDIPVAGHRSDNVPLIEQIDSGQRSFEHVHGLWPATTTDAERLESALARIQLEPDFYYANWFKQINDIEWEAANSYSPTAATSLFERMVAADVAYCPTLVMHANVDLPDSISVNDDRMRYMTPDTPSVWEFVRDHIFHGGGRTSEETTRRIDLFGRRLAAVAAMEEAGVRLLAGTDAVTPGLFPGFSLHEELGLLVQAGLTPLRAIQTATLEPARFFGHDDRAGTIQAGCDADLVILDSDPLVEIRNTRDIHAVVIDGHWVGPQERTELLATASKAADG